MLKRALTWAAAFLVLLLVIGAVIGGAMSISAPVAQADYQGCLKATEAQKNAHPYCKTTETLWDRGLSDPIAYYTLWLTFFTLALATVGVVQGWFTGKAVAISERALTDLERPYLFIKAIPLDWSTPIPSLKVTLHNYGRTPANIADFIVWFRILDHEPTSADEIRAEGPTQKDAAALEIFVGQGEPWSSPIVPCMDWPEAESLQEGGKDLYFWGIVRYRDIFRKTHPTVFCRRFNPGINEWEAVGGFDRNYAD